MPTTLEYSRTPTEPPVVADWVTCTALVPLHQRRSFHAKRCNTVVPLPATLPAICPTCSALVM